MTSPVPDTISEWSRSATASSASRDRKSTRLNSSHDQISYAVFCLKKKKLHKDSIPLILARRKEAPQTDRKKNARDAEPLADALSGPTHCGVTYYLAAAPVVVCLRI